MKVYPIHQLANIVAMASEQEQLALTNDLATRGQEEPIVLWKGEIVDGRCRQLSARSLNVELNVRELGDDLTEEEVGAIVKSLNTRRNLTMTQKTVSAYKQQLRTQETNQVIATQWAISVPTLKNCKYVAVKEPSLIGPLFDGKSVVIYNYSKGEEITTNRINTLAKIIKDNAGLKDVTIDDTHEVLVKYSVEELPLSSPMYLWYGSRLAEYQSITTEGKEMMMKAILFELAKYKEVNSNAE